MEPTLHLDPSDVGNASTQRTPVESMLCTALCAAAILLSGCRSVTPALEELSGRSVSQELAIEPSMAAYKQEKDVKYVLPVAAESNVAPAYPSDVGTKRASSNVAVKVRLSVDANGHVMTVYPLDGSDQGDKRPYFESVVAACTKWTFAPLQARKTSVIPDGEVFGEPKIKVVTETKTLPFSLDYVFSFSEVVSFRATTAK